MAKIGLFSVCFPVLAVSFFPHDKALKLEDVLPGGLRSWFSPPFLTWIGVWLAGMALSGANWGLWPLAWLTPLGYTLCLKLAQQYRLCALWLVVAAMLAGLAEAWVLIGLACRQWELWLACCLLYGLHRWLTFRLMLWVLQNTSAHWQGLSLGCVWATAERLLTQIPYSLPTLLADTQTGGPGLWLMPWLGTYGVACWMVACSWWVWQRRWLPVGLCVVFSGAAAIDSWSKFSPWWPLPSAMTSPWPTSSLQVVQGGLSHWMYQHPQLLSQSLPLVDWYATLSASVGATKGSHLTIWPETALPYLWDGQGDLALSLRSHARHLGDLLIGMPIVDGHVGDQQAYNGAVWLDGQGHTAGIWFKQRLALLAEQQFTPALEQQPLFVWQQQPFAVAFCLETAVPDPLQQAVQQGATAVIGLADGSGFGSGLIGWMHGQRAIVRSAELGRAIVHASSDGAGLVTWPSPLGHQSIRLGSPLKASSTQVQIPHFSWATPWVRWGDWTKWPMVLLPIMGMVVRKRPFQPGSNDRSWVVQNDLKPWAGLGLGLLACTMGFVAYLTWSGLTVCQGLTSWPPPIQPTVPVQAYP